MRRRALLRGLALGNVALAAPALATPGRVLMATVDVGAGLREALALAGDAAIARLGVPGGFADDPIVRIRLPGGLDRVREGLVEAGLGPLVLDLEARMNSAAELVMPATRPLLEAATASLAIENASRARPGAGWPPRSIPWSPKPWSPPVRMPLSTPSSPSIRACR
jgi:hypothetical protein